VDDPTADDPNGELVPFATVADLVEALRLAEDAPSDEVLPIGLHLRQTAEILAAAHPDDPELITAGLVHDLATALDADCADHARVGATLVAPLLGGRVASLVAGHAQAKRYLVTVDASYAGALSPTSTRTLAAQGGPMTATEVDAFRTRLQWASMVALRRADDDAKDPDKGVRPLSAWRTVIEEVAARASQAQPASSDP
jgi:predicted HD phosphohydrolase